MKLILLVSILSLSNAQPVYEQATTEPNDMSTATDEKYVEDLKKQLENVAYRENLKHVLTQYVTTEAKDLTIVEGERVRKVIDDLLENIVRDFRVILKKENVSSEAVDIRIGDSVFDEVRKSARLGVPNVSENDALRLAYRLERNLLLARDRLDTVINEARAARIAYS